MLLICFAAGSAMSQSKIEFGITEEVSLLIPGKHEQYSPPNKNTFSAGIGVYASKGIFGKLSADIGLVYRFKQIKEYCDLSSFTFSQYGGYGGYWYGYSPYDAYEYSYQYDLQLKSWRNFSLNYLVVPLHIQYVVFGGISVRGGIEASWLINSDTGKNKTEINWTIGFGGQKHKLKWFVNYIRGFKDVAFENNLWVRSDGYKSATVYRNNMLQLNISYPFWVKN